MCERNINDSLKIVIFHLRVDICMMQWVNLTSYMTLHFLLKNLSTVIHFEMFKIDKRRRSRKCGIKIIFPLWHIIPTSAYIVQMKVLFVTRRKKEI